MPKPRDTAAPDDAVESQSTALALPDDVLKDLLRAQQDSLAEKPELPQIRIAGAAAGVYEFPDDAVSVNEFQGIILGAHGRNVLWTVKDGSKLPEDDVRRRPQCSSPDGYFGTPQEGFPHAMLNGQPATGMEMLECAKCPYNKFGSGAAFIDDKNPKGKAVTNKKVVYILLPDREIPFALELNTMSIPGYEEYITRLTRKQLPSMAIVTTFRQEKKGTGSSRYAIATFAEGQPLGSAAFSKVLSVYREYQEMINPPKPQPAAAATTVRVASTISEPVEEQGGVATGEEEEVDVDAIPAEDPSSKPPF